MNEAIRMDFQRPERVGFDEAIRCACKSNAACNDHGPGVGRAIAETLARAGATIAVHSITAAETRQTVTAIDEAGGRAFSVEADFLKTAEIGPMVEAAVTKWEVLISL